MSYFEVQLDEANVSLKVVPAKGYEFLPTATCRLEMRQDGHRDNATTVEMDSGTSNVIGMGGEHFNEFSGRVKRACLGVAAAHGDLDVLRIQFEGMN